MLISTLKNILSQYRSDMKSIGKSRAAKLVFVLLMLVPSLYAWFNIAGSWNPYSNTSQLKIAIVNEDEGAVIKEIPVNIGNSTVSELQNNEDLDWQFVSKDEANEGVKSGKYYASIELPQHLSQQIASVSTTTPEKGIIIYNYNDKINAIAPKITERGAETLQQQIETKIRSTVNLVMFKDLVLGGEKLKDNRDSIVNGINELLLLDKNFPEIEKQFNVLLSDATKFQEILPTLKQTLANSSTAINSLQEKLPEIQSTLDQFNAALSLLNTTINNTATNVNTKVQTITTNLATVKTLMATNKPEAQKMLTTISADLSTVSGYLTQALNFISLLNQITPGNHFSNEITQLSALATHVQNIQSLVLQAQDDVNAGRTSTAIDQIIKNITADQTSAQTLFNNFNTVFKTLDTVSTKAVAESFKTITSLLNSYKTVIDTLNTFVIEKEKDFNDALAKGLEVQKKFPEWQKQLDQAALVLQQYSDGQKIDELVTMLSINPSAMANFLNEPISLDVARWYPIENYGAGMTPFYVTLSLWVGTLVLVSIMQVHDKQKSKFGVSFFLGRYLVFLTIVIPQAFIVSSGLLLFFGLSTTSPLAFVLTSILIGISFSMIIYTAVYLFGNLGKALGIILLVLQLVSAGGTFPIEMMPKFFQNVHLFMPFTYAISALRETVGGIVVDVFFKDVMILSLIWILMLLIFLLFHKKLEKNVHRLEEKLEETNVF